MTRVFILLVGLFVMACATSAWSGTTPGASAPNATPAASVTPVATSSPTPSASISSAAPATNVTPTPNATPVAVVTPVAGAAPFAGAKATEASVATAIASTTPVSQATPLVTAAPLITAVPRPSVSREPAPPVRLQAVAGAKVFAAHCAACHGTQLEGGAGPALVGPDFVAAHDHLSLGDVFGMVAYQMPYDAPGSLSHADYEDIVAFLMARNGRTLAGPGLVYEAALKSTAPFLSPAP